MQKHDMLKHKWMPVGLTTALLATSVLAGCSTEETGSDPAQTSASEQVLNLALSSEIPTMDSSKATDNLAFRVLGQVNEGLVRLDSQGTAQPGVAKTWEVSQDGLTYTFHLRDDAKWSDGSTVTAKDFEYAWKRTLKPETGAEYAFMLSWLKGGAAYNENKGSAEDVGVKAQDDRTLVVTLDHPIPFFVEQTSFPIFYPQKQAFVEQQGATYGSDFDKTLYNGPFKMSEWVHEQSTTLVKNEQYWDRAAVKLEKVFIQFVKDSGALENLYQSGELDRISLVRDQVDRYKDQQDQFKTLPDLAVGYFQFNQMNKVLANANIRKALTYAVDGDKYADIVYHNGTKGATGFVPVGVSNGNGGEFRADNGDLLKRSENEKQAKQLLAAGLKELGLEKLPQLKLIYDDGEMGIKATEFIKEQWRQKLDIDVQVENIPFKLKLQRQRAGDFEIVLSLWIGDYNDPMTFLDLWVSNGPFNDSKYNSPQYDELVKSAEREKDKKKRMQYLLEAEKQLLNDMPVGPVFFRGNAVLMRPYIKGWVEHLGAPDVDLKHVYIEGK